LIGSPDRVRDSLDLSLFPPLFHPNDLTDTTSMNLHLDLMRALLALDYRWKKGVETLENNILLKLTVKGVVPVVASSRTVVSIIQLT
jgi:hypothetical protein